MRQTLLLLLILSTAIFAKLSINTPGSNINTSVNLDAKVEKILKEYKKSLNADEILITLMESKTGRIILNTSSNGSHRKSIEYSYEPGSVINPLIFALLLDHKLINQYELINCENGRYKIQNKFITDSQKFDWIRAEDIIVYSSNIGISKLAQKLSAATIHDGFIRFGITVPSGINLPKEKKGTMPTIDQLNNVIYKATTSYGYGVRANLVQLVKAYNVFNNNGRILTPYLDDNTTKHRASVQIITPETAQRMKKILIRTVKRGTAVNTRIKGLKIGGKTGTAHIAGKGGYLKKYNASFIGFVNDTTNKYTMGITVIQPRIIYFASRTAVVIFKAIVESLVDDGYLLPRMNL